MPVAVKALLSLTMKIYDKPVLVYTSWLIRTCDTNNEYDYVNKLILIK